MFITVCVAVPIIIIIKRVCVRVCVYYCNTYYRAGLGGGGGEWRTCATRDYEPRPMSKDGLGHLR